MKKLLTYLLLLLILASCTAILSPLAGIKKAKALTDAEIRNYATAYGIPDGEAYKIDVAQFKAIYRQQDDSLKRKDWHQPLQVKSYDSEGQLNAHLINCIVSGFPKVNWNYWQSFDGFPLSQGKARKIDFQMSLEEELSLIQKLDSSTPIPPANSQFDEYLIVYWCRMMHKRSEELVDYVQAYRNRHADKSIAVVFVNVDGVFE